MRNRLMVHGRSLLMLIVLSMATRFEARPADTTLVRQIDEVTVSAPAAVRPLTSAVPIQTISGDKLQQLGIQGLADAVRRFAGTTVRDYGGIGGMKTVSVRSLGAHHTAIAYDGVAVSNTQAGQIDIGRFATDRIETLTLAVGETYELLQPARLAASAATLAIRTETPRFGNGRRYRLAGQLKAGSFGLLQPTIGAALKLTEQTTVQAHADLLRADGRYPFTLTNGAYRTRERRTNTDIVTGQIEADLHHVSSRDELRIKLCHFTSERGLPGSVILYNNGNRERLWDDNFFLQSVWRRRLATRWTFEGQLKYNYSWNRYEDTDVKYPDGRQTDRHTQREYYASAAARFDAATNLQLSVAQDGVVNTLVSRLDGYDHRPQPVRYTALTALRARFTTGGLTLTGTLLNTFITERVRYDSRPPDRLRLTPSLAAIYRPFEQYYFNLRAMYKKTFRVPSFNDLYYLRLGNTGLRPELADEFNVGITWSGTPLAHTEYATLTVDAFHNRVTDKIVAFPSTYVWKMANFGRVRIWGADVTASAGITLPAGMTLALASNYTYQHATDHTSATAKNYRHQIPYTPRHSGHLSALLHTPWIQAGYTLTAVGTRYSMQQNIPVNRIDGYMEHTVALSRTFRLKQVTLNLKAECVNLTDTQYDIIKFYPMPGRSFRTTVGITI